LQGLEKPSVWPIPEGQEKEAVASAKMSKSKPETCIFIYDTPAEIKQKMARAFCTERTIAFNPVIDICKHIIFREKPVFTIERPAKFGGTIDFHSFPELEAAYAQGKLHPQDLKNGVADELAMILEPVRRYFATNTEAQKCLNAVREAKITR
jgi:tyrosyl-tRNA synthetase